MKKIHIATSPLSNTIFAGHVLKDRRTWAAGKQDVTIEAVAAVIDYVLRAGGKISLNCEDYVYDISVEYEALAME